MPVWQKRCTWHFMAFHGIYRKILPFINKYEMHEFNLRCLNLFLYLEDHKPLKDSTTNFKYHIKGNIGDFNEWARATAAMSFAIVGRFSEAKYLFCSSIVALPDEGGSNNVRIAKENLVNFVLLPEGQILSAMLEIEKQINVKQPPSTEAEASVLEDFAYATHLSGNLQKARILYNEINEFYKKNNLCIYGLAVIRYSEFLIDCGKNEEAHEALNVCEAIPSEKNVEVGRHLAIKSKLYMFENIAEAQIFLDKALHHLKLSGWMGEIAKIYITRAQFMRSQKLFFAAQKELIFAQEIISDSHMKLYATDAALLSAHLALDCKDNPLNEIDDELTLGLKCPERDDYIIVQDK